MEGESQTMQPVNYCAHIIEQTAAQLGENPDNLVMRNVAAGLQQAQKFLLPDCADMVEIRDLKEAHMDLLHLPYPLVALEIPWQHPNHGNITGGIHATSSSTKRVVLAWHVKDAKFEPWPGFNNVVIAQLSADDAIAFIAVAYIDRFQAWMPMVSACVIPMGQKPVPVRDTTAMILADAMHGITPAKTWKHTLDYHLMPLMTETQARLEEAMGKHAAELDAELNIHDEMIAVIKFANVVNCANITTTKLGAPKSINKKREAKGKQPFFEYHVLDVTPEQGERESGSDGTSDRHGPRAHLRRGHIRRLPKKAVWVRHALVGNPKQGVVRKDYRIETPKG
jgi:hypothetical protein